MNNISEDRALRQMLKEGQPIAVFPRGVSMRPLIRQGKTCVGLLPLTKEPQIGDVVAFIRPSDNANIIHRLVAIEGDTYITRGDNCLGCEYSKREQLFGVAEWVRTGSRTLYSADPRYQSYVRLWTKTWPIRKRVFQLREQYFRLRHAVGKMWPGKIIKAVRGCEDHANPQAMKPAKKESGDEG